MWITGGNSPAFHIAGLAHPAFRTAMLPREFMRRRHFTVNVRIGHPASANWVERRGASATAYLRTRCESLRPQQRRFPVLRLQPLRALAAPVPKDRLAQEIASLGPDRRLAKGTALEVWRLQMHDAPTVLREIGRLRELTFRDAGEGTGKPLQICSQCVTNRDLRPGQRHIGALAKPRWFPFIRRGSTAARSGRGRANRRGEANP